MATYGAQNYTSFSAVNLKGSVALRVGDTNSAYSGTLSIRGASLDGSREWHFPDKSGAFPIMGTFAVQLPAATAAAFSTIVTVSGITVEDALVVQFNGGSGSAQYGFANSTGHILVQAIPGAGQITLQFQNLGNATGYIQLVGSYLAMR